MGDAHFTAGDEATAVLLNRTVVSGDDATQGVSTFIWYARIRYTGTVWEVESAHSVAGLTSAKLVWNGTTDELDITMVTSNDFVSNPIMVTTPVIGNSIHVTKAQARESGGVITGSIKFYQENNGNPVDTEDTDMDLNIVIIGQYV